MHVRDTAQALRNVGVAVAAGADGVWLISHGSVDMEELLHDVAAEVREAHPRLFLGVNCLGDGDAVFAAVAALPFRVDGIWCDTMGVRTPEQWRRECKARREGEGPLPSSAADFAAAPQPHAERFLAARDAARAWAYGGGLCFGGVSFKYIDENERRSAADEQALLDVSGRYCDVLTTSGAGTGRAAAVDKMRLLRANAARAPTAVASGVALDNVDACRECVDVYLVASSIQRGGDFHELDAAKTAQLCARIHSFRAGAGAGDEAAPAADVKRRKLSAPPA